MANEALWGTGAGVSYSADEDRRIISGIWNPGIISGGVISAGTGLAASVSPGIYVVSDGQGGAYFAPIDATTTVSGLTASSSNSLYVTVDPTTFLPTIVKGSAPANPNVRIGAATTSGTAVTSTSKGTVASFRLQALTATSMTVAGALIASATGVQLPKGYILGGAANAQMRYAVRASRALSRQLIPASTWTTVAFDRIDRPINDYGGTSVNITGANQGLFVAPVAGTYQVSAQAHFVNQAGTANARREMRMVNRSSAGAARWVKYGTMRSAGDNFDHVQFDGTVDMQAGQTVELQVYQDENKSVYLSDNATGVGSMDGGDMTYGSMTLLVAD